MIKSYGPFGLRGSEGDSCHDLSFQNRVSHAYTLDNSRVDNSTLLSSFPLNSHEP